MTPTLREQPWETPPGANLLLEDRSREEGLSLVKGPRCFFQMLSKPPSRMGNGVMWHSKIHPPPSISSSCLHRGEAVIPQQPWPGERAGADAGAFPFILWPPITKLCSVSVIWWDQNEFEKPYPLAQRSSATSSFPQSLINLTK